MVSNDCQCGSMSDYMRSQVAPLESTSPSLVAEPRRCLVSRMLISIFLTREHVVKSRRRRASSPRDLVLVAKPRRCLVSRTISKKKKKKKKKMKKKKKKKKKK